MRLLWNNVVAILYPLSNIRRLVDPYRNLYQFSSKADLFAITGSTVVHVQHMHLITYITSFQRTSISLYHHCYFTQT